MSSSPPPASALNGKKKSASAKGVRFAAGTARAAPERKVQQQPQGQAARRKKRPRPNVNADELDDVDDWKPEDDDYGDDIDDPSVPKTHEQLKAKRERANRRRGDGGGDDDNGDEFEATDINQTTSLTAEGIEVEPFHMKNEETDGSGYFDGDTYVFRTSALKEDKDEPDAWLDSLGDDNNKKGQTYTPTAASNRNPVSGQTNIDQWTVSQLHAKIVPHVSDSETVMQAIARYGNLLKKKEKKKKQQVKGDSTGEGDDEEIRKLAQTALNELTEASSALLLKGQTDIYEQTRTDLMTLLERENAAQQGGSTANADGDNKSSAPDHSATAVDAKKNEAAASAGATDDAVQWEYRGNQDGQIHGPYTTQNMLGWISAGYFVGATAVQVRSVRQTAPSLKDDLLNDLMDDDEEGKESEAAAAVAKTRGEWQRSDQINFRQYLGPEKS